MTPPRSKSRTKRSDRQQPAFSSTARASEPHAEAFELTEHDGGVRFGVHITPRASRAAITGTHAGALKLSLTAPPVEGAANAALIELLATALEVPKRAVVIEQGERSRHKRVRVVGVNAARVRALLPP